ncbi:hypothetical protein [Streptomyces sp. NPDC048710]|uniref:hypothetical protein n=1 Tax=Streptomyces sp. NPDC048710 TaxID=3365586 RepID=UPI00371E8F74
MRITVLTVPDCPHAPLVAERLNQALDGRDAEVERIEVDDQEQASRLGMTGSPTVLVDGVDPFAVPGTTASLSCRLYRRPDGHVDGAPSLAELRRALGGAAAVDDCDCAVVDDCDCPAVDVPGRGRRGRLAPAAIDREPRTELPDPCPGDASPAPRSC